MLGVRGKSQEELQEERRRLEEEYKRYEKEISELPEDKLQIGTFTNQPDGELEQVKVRFKKTLLDLCSTPAPDKWSKLHDKIKEVLHEQRWRAIQKAKKQSEEWRHQAEANLAAGPSQARPASGVGDGQQQSLNIANHQAEAPAPQAQPRLVRTQGKSLGAKHFNALQSGVHAVNKAPLNLQPSTATGPAGPGGGAQGDGRRRRKCTSCNMTKELVRGEPVPICADCAAGQGALWSAKQGSFQEPALKSSAAAAAAGREGAAARRPGSILHPQPLGALSFYAAAKSAPASGRPLRSGDAVAREPCGPVHVPIAEPRTRSSRAQQQQHVQHQATGRKREEAADDEYEPPKRQSGAGAGPGAGRQRGQRRSSAAAAAAAAAQEDKHEPIDLADSSDDEVVAGADAPAPAAGPGLAADAAAAAAGGVSTRRTSRASAGAGAAAAGAAACNRSDYDNLNVKLKGLKCCFPPDGGKHSVEIVAEDLARLEPGEFLNDTCIDFYIKYIEHHLPPEVRQRYHFFNTFFVKKLMEKQPGQGSKQSKEAQAQNHDRVKKWTKHVDLFSKDFIFVPIHDHLHWSLMLVCHPGKVVQDERYMPPGQRVDPEAGMPIILHLDSLEGSHGPRPYYDALRAYLGQEWRRKAADETHESVPRRWRQAWEASGKTPPADPDFSTGRNSVMSSLRISARLPKQDNHYDCGLFLLSYMDFFSAGSPRRIVHTGSGKPKDLTAVDPSPEAADDTFLQANWFFKANTARLRDHLRCLICELLLERMPQDDARRGAVEGVVKEYRERPARPGERYLPPKEFLQFRQANPNAREPVNVDVIFSDSDPERVGGEEDPQDVLQGPPRRLTRAAAKQSGAKEVDTLAAIGAAHARPQRRKAGGAGAANGAAAAGPPGTQAVVDLSSPDKVPPSDAAGSQPPAGTTALEDKEEAGCSAGAKVQPGIGVNGAGDGSSADGGADAGREDMVLQTDSGDEVEAEDVTMMDAGGADDGPPASGAAAPPKGGAGSEAEEGTEGGEERPHKRPRCGVTKTQPAEASDVVAATQEVEAMGLDDTSGEEPGGTGAPHPGAAAPEAASGPAPPPHAEKRFAHRRKHAAGGARGDQEGHDGATHGGAADVLPLPVQGQGESEDAEEDDPELLPWRQSNRPAGPAAGAAAAQAGGEDEADVGAMSDGPGPSGRGGAGAPRGDAAGGRQPKPSAGKKCKKIKAVPPAGAAVGSVSPSLDAAVAATEAAAAVGRTVESVHAELLAVPGLRPSMSPRAPAPQSAAHPVAGGSPPGREHSAGDGAWRGQDDGPGGAAHGSGAAAQGPMESSPLHVPEHRPGCSMHVRYHEGQQPEVEYMPVRPLAHGTLPAGGAGLPPPAAAANAGQQGHSHDRRAHSDQRERQRQRTSGGSLPAEQQRIDDSIVGALDGSGDATAAEHSAGRRGAAATEEDEEDDFVNLSYPSGKRLSSGGGPGPLSGAATSSGHCPSSGHPASQGARDGAHGRQPPGLDLTHVPPPGLPPRRASEGSSAAVGLCNHPAGRQSGIGPLSAGAAPPVAATGTAAGCDVSARALFGQACEPTGHSTSLFRPRIAALAVAGGGTGRPPAPGAATTGFPQPANLGAKGRQPAVRLEGLRGSPCSAVPCAGRPFVPPVPQHVPAHQGWHQPGGGAGDRATNLEDSQRGPEQRQPSDNKIRRQKSECLQRRALAKPGQPQGRAASDDRGAPTAQQQPQQPMLVLPPTAESEDAVPRELAQQAPPEESHSYGAGLYHAQAPESPPAAEAELELGMLEAASQQQSRGLGLQLRPIGEDGGGAACDDSGPDAAGVNAGTQASDAAGLSLELAACLTQAAGGDGANQAAGRAAGSPGPGGRGAGGRATGAFSSALEALPHMLSARLPSNQPGHGGEPLRPLEPLLGAGQGLGPAGAAGPWGTAGSGAPEQPIDLAEEDNLQQDGEEAVPDSDEDYALGLGQDRRRGGGYADSAYNGPVSDHAHEFPQGPPRSWLPPYGPPAGPSAAWGEEGGAGRSGEAAHAGLAPFAAAHGAAPGTVMAAAAPSNAATAVARVDDAAAAAGASGDAWFEEGEQPDGASDSDEEVEEPPEDEPPEDEDPMEQDGGRWGEDLQGADQDSGKDPGHGQDPERIVIDVDDDGSEEGEQGEGEDDVLMYDEEDATSGDGDFEQDDDFEPETRGGPPRRRSAHTPRGHGTLGPQPQPTARQQEGQKRGRGQPRGGKGAPKGGPRGRRSSGGSGGVSKQGGSGGKQGSRRQSGRTPARRRGASHQGSMDRFVTGVNVERTPGAARDQRGAHSGGGRGHGTGQQQRASGRKDGQDGMRQAQLPGMRIYARLQK